MQIVLIDFLKRNEKLYCCLHDVIMNSPYSLLIQALSARYVCLSSSASKSGFGTLTQMGVGFKATQAWEYCVRGASVCGYYQALSKVVRNDRLEIGESVQYEFYLFFCSQNWSVTSKTILSRNELVCSSCAWIVKLIKQDQHIIYIYQFYLPIKSLRHIRPCINKK